MTKGRAYIKSFQGIFFIAVTLFILFKFLSIFKPSTNTCIEEKKMHFKGVVSDIVTDSFNKAQKFIFLNENEKILTPYTYGLWNEISIGDSIVKEEGTLDYIIYQRSNGSVIKTLKWDKVCE